MIQRYWIDRTDADAPYESEDGEMVLYADHERIVRELEQENAALKLRLERADGDEQRG